ncbi:MAG: CcmD family protein [Minicystis sp.]
MSMDLPPGPPPATKPAATTTPTPAPTGVPTTPDDRSTTFKPVTGAPEMQSGEKLLVEAYAAIWLILFALVLLSWRRQGKLEARIAHLDDAIVKARGPGKGDG